MFTLASDRNTNFVISEYEMSTKHVKIIALFAHNIIFDNNITIIIIIMLLNTMPMWLFAI